jgi:hypothetical protein
MNQRLGNRRIRQERAKGVGDSTVGWCEIISVCKPPVGKALNQILAGDLCGLPLTLKSVAGALTALALEQLPVEFREDVGRALIIFVKVPGDDDFMPAEIITLEVA